MGDPLRLIVLYTALVNWRDEGKCDELFLSFCFFCFCMISFELGLESMPCYGMLECGANQAAGLTSARVVKVLLLARLSSACGIEVEFVGLFPLSDIL